MNPIGQLITFIASASIILYFLLIGFYLRRIMLAVEKLAGSNQARILECSNCGKTINLGVGFKEPYINCPGCKTRIVIEQAGDTILNPVQQRDKVFP